MKNPIITIDDFSGGATLNPAVGRKNGFHIGNKLDFSSKRGFLAPGNAWVNVQLNGANDVVTRFPHITHLTNGEFLLGGQDGRIYRASTDINSIVVVRTSSQTGGITGVAEYQNHYYYAQQTTIGRYALGGTWVDNWQTGLQNVPFHPIKVSADGILYIGNGRFVAMFNGNGPVWNATRLDLADNWQIRCLEDFGMLYLAIGASFRGVGGSITSKVFLWDRISLTWNDEIIIPESEIKAMKFVAGYLWIWAGRSCNLYVVPEGSRTATRIHTFTKEDPSESFEVYPGAVIEKNGVIYFGLSRVMSTSRENNPCGIYSFPYNPQNFTLNMPFNRYFENEGSNEDYWGLGLFHGTSGVGGDIIFTSQSGVGQQLFRERLMWADTSYYSDITTYESFEYRAPLNGKIMTEMFGIVTEPLPAGASISLFYKTGNNWLPVFENFSTPNSTEKTWPRKMEVNSLKMRLTIRAGTTRGARPFLKALFVTGDVISKAI